MKIRYLLITLLAILLFIVAYIFFLRKDETMNREQVISHLKTPDSHFYDWEGLQVHYTEYSKRGESVLLVHGFGASLNHFTPLADTLKEHYHVYAIDLPAFGLTEVPNKDSLNAEELISYHIKFIIDFLDEANIQSCHIIGNSLGGLLAWNTVAAHQDRFLSLTLLNSAGYEIKEITENVAGGLNNPLAKKIIERGSPIYVNRAFLERTFYDDSLVTDEQVRNGYYANNKKGTLEWMSYLVESHIKPDTTLIKTIEIPTLIVWGQQDQLIDVGHAFKFERDIPNSSLVIYDKMGHLPMMENTAKLAIDWMNFEKDL